jgi:hypothetical protein
VVSFTPLLLYPRGKIPWYPLDRRLGWPRNQSGHCGYILFNNAVSYSDSVAWNSMMTMNNEFLKDVDGSGCAEFKVLPW